MPLFKVVSRAGCNRHFEFEGVDVASALAVADKHQLTEADLWQDGSHICTIRRDGENSDLWMIAGVRQKVSDQA